MEEKLNEQEFDPAVDNIDNSATDEEDDFSAVDASGSEAISTEENVHEDKEITAQADDAPPALNQSAEFLRKFAESFSEAFVLDVPNSEIVENAIKKANENAEKKLMEQIGKENARKKDLVARLAELQKQQ